MKRSFFRFNRNIAVNGKKLKFAKRRFSDEVYANNFRFQEKT